MDIPWWLPWAVLVAALPAAVTATGSRLARGAPAAVALVVAIVLTVDWWHVSDAELADATDQAAGLVDGALGGTTSAQLTTLIGDRLGRPVHLSRASAGSSQASPSQRLEVRVAQDDGGPVEDGAAACLAISSYPVEAASPGLTREVLTASSGGCD